MMWYLGRLSPSEKWCAQIRIPEREHMRMAVAYFSFEIDAIVFAYGVGLEVHANAK